jgi:hypothetical protein
VAITLDRDEHDPAGAPRPTPQDVGPPEAPQLPAWWREVIALAVLYGLYSTSRLLVRADEAPAIRRGERVLTIEKLLHIDIEPWLNVHAVSVAPVAIIACYAYATLHFTITPAVLVWARVRHQARYAIARNHLIVITLIGLCLYWLLPTAPPRLLGAPFIDAMARFADHGWWAGTSSTPAAVSHLTNEFAAFPSLHFAWALWCAWWLQLSSRRWLRLMGAAYPMVVAIVVVVTANHYLLDVVAGGVVVVVARLAVEPIARRSSGSAELVAIGSAS